ncbi:MAG: OmpA family protein [Aquificaceae bacterium]
MKRFGLVILSSMIVFAQDAFQMRLLDGVNQMQRSIELAKEKNVDRLDPYHFEKARANRDVAYILASNMDEVGSKLFMVKSFNALSKAFSNKAELDEINLIKAGDLPTIDVESLNSKLSYVRENKALSCAPAELARAEAFYEALSYELSKPKPDLANLVDFYYKAFADLGVAVEKVNVAREGRLECYTGEAYVPEQAKAQELPPPAQEAMGPKAEPLMVAARVHFDFDKYTIKREYIPLLNEVVKILKENPNVRIRIEGYTDNIGPKAYNDKLALKRAKAVKDYLVKAGIPEDRIEIAGFGKEKYIASNDSPIGRFTNRRADFIVIQVPGQ